MTWAPVDLDALDRSDEVEISSYRPDGTLRPFVTIWAVRIDTAVYVRSAYGGGGWFHRATVSGTGRLRFAGLEHDVAFAAPTPEEQPAIDEAYRAKYGRYGSTVSSMLGPAIYEHTLRLDAV